MDNYNTYDPYYSLWESQSTVTSAASYNSQIRSMDALRQYERNVIRGSTWDIPISDLVKKEAVVNLKMLLL